MKKEYVCDLAETLLRERLQKDLYNLNCDKEGSYEYKIDQKHIWAGYDDLDALKEFRNAD
jgi:hypothetical protein